MPNFRNAISGWLGMSKAEQPKMIEEDQIQPGEILDAGFDIPKGDPRLKSGITRSNLTDSEREMLDTYRKNKK